MKRSATILASCVPLAFAAACSMSPGRPSTAAFTAPKGGPAENIETNRAVNALTPLTVTSATSAVGARQPLIQIALLLDTSGSMSGLIEQTKTQLWSIVNEMAAYEVSGKRPLIQVALYEYGKSALSAEEGYIRQILPLSTDLDKLSEELFALQTNGGDEYCGWVIQRAARDLAWSESGDDLKAIFIAGNEPFSQGPVFYADACREAVAKGVVVNTIHCGGEAQGVSGRWKDGAVLADGDFFAIDHNQAIVSIAAPQDAEITRLGVVINETYIPYGAQGEAGAAGQMAQDRNAIHQGNLAERAASKGSSAYNNAHWDLVDATDGEVKIEEMKDADLPENMRAMNAEERKQYVEAMRARRADISNQIGELQRARRQFIEDERKRMAAESGAKTLDQALLDSVRGQAAKKRFETPARADAVAASEAAAK